MERTKGQGRAAARLRALAPYLAMAGGGLLLRGAFAPFEGQASIAFFAPVPLFLASRLCAPRKAAKLGFVWGFAFFASALTWFVPLVRNGGPWPIVLLGEVGLSAWCALFPALAAAALSRLRAPWRGLRESARAAHARMVAAEPDSDEEDEAFGELAALRRRSLLWEIAGPLAAGLVWAGAETLRATVGGGFAWYSLGASQRAFPALAQLAAAGGTALVSAVVATVADALAGVALRAWDTIRHTPGSTRRHLDLTVALVALLAAFLWGSRHASDAQRLERAADRSLLVAAVNPRMPCIFSQNDAAAREAEDRLVTLSASAALLHPDLVAWPETTLPDVLPSPRLEADMVDLSGMIGAPILAGSTELPPGETLRAASLVWNSAWVFSTNGISPPYRKRHLVPFGEFIPLDETIPALRRLSPAGVSCAAGAGPVLLPVARRGAEGPDDAALVSPLICFEDTVPATARASARGADVLLSISNDAWFEGTCESAQHHAEAAFRAIENGIPLVRVSNHGATGVVLPSGEATPDATGGFLVHAVPLLPRGRAPTPYARFGDWLFGFPCAALALLAAFLPARRRSDSGIPH